MEKFSANLISRIASPKKPRIFSSNTIMSKRKIKKINITKGNKKTWQ